MEPLLKRLRLLAIYFCLLAASASVYGAGSWNGFAFTAWNGVAVTAWNGTGVAVGGGGGFTAYTAGFDGTTNYITKSGSLTGIDTGDANSKTITCSFWIDFTGRDGQYQGILNIRTSSTVRFEIYKTNTNKISVTGYDSGGTAVLVMTTTNSLVAADGWKHIYIWCNLASTTGKIYFNGVAETLTGTTFTNTAMDLYNTSTPNFNIGCTDGGGTNKLAASIAEFWFDDQNLDDTTKFASGGHPISLGATGSTPTGTAPALYLSRSGSGDTWLNDSSGNSHVFTLNGSTLGSPTAP